MNQTPLPVRAAALLTVLMLLLAACGGGATTDEPGSLPPNDNPGNTPAAGGTCLEGEPDCNDTPSGGSALPLPNEGEPDSGTGGMPVDGGLTVSDALASDARGVIAVRGFLIADETGARLCEVLAESYPPQCGGAGLPVSGYEEVLDVPSNTAQGITWTDQPISLLGEIVDGTLLVDPTLAG